MAAVRVGVLLSGRGSNLQALLDARAASWEVAIAVADVEDAPGLARAEAAGVPALAIPRRDFADRAAFEDAFDAALRTAGADLVVLAGFMRVLGPEFVVRWYDRLVNIHPSLLPAFRGLDTHRRALAAGVGWHGCTVHFVRAALDAGPIILQAAVPVRPDDTEEALAARVLAREHHVLPQAIGWIADGRIRVENERVVAADPEDMTVNPSQ
ncbi:MAG: phosphoribosylglycinamide formyltransferase [Alphaproteobacteria bacterium]|nr:phosphoribosylglycinamide formyltransferase [Alphaproteobacteria bacterium]MCY4317964.1 phosphoribosylglycinamide formyltransferase [Alphaproteobacteria bacterium]